MERTDEGLVAAALEFEAQYASNSGITIEELRSRRIVIPCDCEYEGCRGWASIMADALPDYKEMGWVKSDWSWPPPG